MEILKKEHLKIVKEFNSFIQLEDIYKRTMEFEGLKGVEVITLGYSAGKRPIHCVKIGSGKKKVLIFGFPHANEPVGSLTCLSLIKIILNDERLRSIFTWHIIPCADPDGAKFNDGWLSCEFNIDNYVRNYYRGAMAEQTDLSFPVKYKSYKFNNSPKHVKALAKFIRSVKPDFVYPLHDAGTGGVFILITRDMTYEYYDKLIGYCKHLGLPLHFGEPDMPFMKKLKQPIFLNFGFKEFYDNCKELGGDTKILDFGTDSINYAREFNKEVFGLVCEVPYFVDHEISDSSPSSMTKRDLLLKARGELKANIEFMKSVLKNAKTNKASVYYLSVHEDLDVGLEQLKELQEDIKKTDRDLKATVAQVYSHLVEDAISWCTTLSTLRKLLLESCARPGAETRIKKLDKMIAEKLDKIKQSSSLKKISVSKLVQMQIGALILTLNEIWG